jgi:hypothetical protein
MRFWGTNFWETLGVALIQRDFSGYFVEAALSGSGYRAYGT